MEREQIHVMPENDYWSVRKSGTPGALSTYPTREMAIEAGRAIARLRGYELIIHAADGSIAQRETERANGIQLRQRLKDFLAKVLKPNVDESEDRKAG